MNFFETFINALSNLSLNRLRSGLTLMGVVIGVASVIAVSSIVEVGKQMTVSMIEKLGTNLLSVRPKTLTEEEQEALAVKETLNEKIATLTSYRKSLIHECVTGQRRVTEEDVRRAGCASNIPPMEHRP